MSNQVEDRLFIVMGGVSLSPALLQNAGNLALDEHR